MSILVVGSVALDSVETPFGKVEDALGGSASYFSTAATLYAPVSLVAVVGDDFPQEHVELLRKRGVDLAGLQVREGKTFRWGGSYDFDLNTAHTLFTHLNVFADFAPELPAHYREAEFVFCANIQPELQLQVLRQMRSPKLTVLDTMNLWIAERRAALSEAISAVDIVLMNEAEVRQYAGTYSLMRGARQILGMGPRALVVKRGEYGAALFTDSDYFVIPAYPLEEVKDPTGAGDSFAAGFVGYLASCGEVNAKTIRCAMAHGTVVASFTVGDFSVGKLRTLTREDIAARFAELQACTVFGE